MSLFIACESKHLGCLQKSCCGSVYTAAAYAPCVSWRASGCAGQVIPGATPVLEGQFRVKTAEDTNSDFSCQLCRPDGRLFATYVPSSERSVSRPVGCGGPGGTHAEPDGRQSSCHLFINKDAARCEEDAANRWASTAVAADRVAPTDPGMLPGRSDCFCSMGCRVP